jgi:uncharacterized membrane protein
MGPLGVLFGPMMCGMYLCYLARMRGERPEFGVLLKGFDYFFDAFVATLITMGIMMLACMPLVLMVIAGVIGALTATAVAVEPGPQGDAGSGSAVLLVFIIVGVLAFIIFAAIIMLAAILLAFVYPLIVDRGLKAIPALRVSACGAWANLGGMVALTLLLALIGTVAALFFYFPVFLVMPISFGAMVTAYRKIFPETRQLPEAEMPGLATRGAPTPTDSSPVVGAEW